LRQQETAASNFPKDFARRGNPVPPETAGDCPRIVTLPADRVVPYNAADSVALQPGSTLGPYEVLALIGAGGMGEVYRARDLRLNRDVAIKVLPPDRVGDESRRRRFVQEAQAVSALNHPHIITIYEMKCTGFIGERFV
jgi:serine/threonine protein kinase